MRYHPATQSVIVALITPDGTVQGVHRTLLTPDGENVRGRRDGRKLKLARGPQDGVCLRLPAADPASPILLHGEGLETVMSPWSAAGYEARVYFGNIAERATLERGRVNVLLVDDDEGWVRPEQRDQWVPITGWDGGADAELARVRAVLEAWPSGDAHGPPP